MTAADSQAPEVLYLGGFGRSGSTLLERSVGELGDVCAVGELVHLWERGLGDNELCGCGQPFRECTFWTEVGEVAFGGWDALDAEHVASLKHAVDRNRHFGRLLLGSRFGTFGRQLGEYAALYDAIYRAVGQVSGARLIVDSSKHASLALCLRMASRSRIRIAHVVRDSPAVVYSWAKVVERPESTGDIMARYTPGRAALWWNSYNLMFTLIGLTRIPLRRVRYEDFMRDPLETVRGLASWAGSAADPADYLSHDVVHLSAGHTVAGNPMRFRYGDIAIRRDQEWASAMSPGLQQWVRLWTFPFRWRYGYFKRADARRQETMSTAAKDRICAEVAAQKPSHN